MTRSPRAVARTAVPLAGAALVWIATSPAAWAARRDDGEQRGPGLSVLETLGFYVGIPLLVVLVVTLLTLAPSGARSPRYRPGLTWWAEPVWIGGPSGGAQSAVAGSASSNTAQTSAAGRAAVSELTGGARARW